MNFNELKKIQNRKVSFVIKEVFPNCIYLQFGSYKSLTSTLIRFAEHYESPKFRNKIFSMYDFFRWYQKEKGKFSYLDDWSGFNIPSKAFQSFQNEKFKNITTREGAVLKILPQGKFYVIASVKKDSRTIKHELAHALFFLDSKYKKKVLSILKKIKNPNPALTMIQKTGYHKSVLLDELNAYILSDFSMIKSSGSKVSPSIKKELETLFKTTMKRIKNET